MLKMGKMFLTIPIIFLFGCTSYRTIISNEKYSNEDFTGRTMYFIYSPLDSVNVKNIDDVTDDFNCDTSKVQNIIRDSSYKYIVNESRLWLQDADVKVLNKSQAYLSQKIDTSKYFSFTKKLGMDTIQYQFFVPKESYLFSQGIEPDIVVVINKLFFSREPEEFIQEIPYATAGSNPAGGANMYHYKYTTDYLVGDVLFVIWDYKKNDVITYGHFYDETLPFINMTKSTWHKSFENIADRIFLFSPFKWEYDYKKMIKKINTKDKIWKHNE